jgi:hypothetical protein
MEHKELPPLNKLIWQYETYFERTLTPNYIQSTPGSELQRKLYKALHTDDPLDLPQEQYISKWGSRPRTAEKWTKALRAKGIRVDNPYKSTISKSWK